MESKIKNNMRKFKHKKTGSVAEQRQQQNSSDYKYIVKSEKYDLLPKYLVENSSDWEEIEDKEYEILTITADERNVLEKPLENILPYEGDGSLWGYWQIHSVKRLSDNSVFQLGDRVKGIGFPITKIPLNKEGCVVPYLECGNQGVSLFYAQKVKPVFFTEDRVEIYEGDEYWFVDSSFNAYWNESIEGQEKFRINKYFSTKEAAQEYIDQNKPKYSLNDIKKVFEVSNGVTMDFLIDRLENQR